MAASINSRASSPGFGIASRSARLRTWGWRETLSGVASPLSTSTIVTAPLARRTLPNCMRPILWLRKPRAAGPEAGFAVEPQRIKIRFHLGACEHFGSRGAVQATARRHIGGQLHAEPLRQVGKHHFAGL